MAGNRLSTEILINLAGNLQAKARQYGASMSEFASRNQRAMSIVRATSEAAGRGLDKLGNRYTGMIAGIGSSLTIKQVADFDAQMRRMGTDAQLSAEEVANLHEKIRDVSSMPDIRIEASAIGQGVGELLGKTGDYEFAQKNLRNMGVLMQAFGVDGQTAAGLLAQFWEKGVRGADDVSNMLDKLYAQFAVGSVSVADIAKVAPKLFSIVQEQGPTAIAQMGAFAQVFAKNKGSVDETVTSIQAMYAALSNKKNIAFLKANGIDVFKKGTKELKLPFELMKEILKRAKNDPIKLQDVFDQTGMQGINSLLKPENIQLMEKLIYGTVEYGSTQKAAKTNAEGFNAAMQSLNNEWQRFAESELAKPIQDLADSLNSVDHETVQNWLNIGKQIAIAGAAAIAARKAFQIGKGTWDFFKTVRGKGGKGGVAGGIADVFGSGVMPVYVVNMGSGGMGGGITDALGEAGSRGGGRAGRFGRFARGAGKFAGVAGAGFALYDHLENNYQLDGKVDDLTKQVAANTAASPQERAFAEESQRNRQALKNKWEQWFGSSDAPRTQIVDPRPWAAMTPTIPVVNFASVPAPSDPKGPNIPQIQGNEHSLWAAITDFFMGANTTIESGMPSVKQQDNSPQLPPVPQKLQGEIRVVVEGDARVKSVKMDQPGVTLSASAGVSNVEQN
ncbi:phage tail protein [Citrobacter portucalensis]